MACTVSNPAVPNCRVHMVVSGAFAGSTVTLAAAVLDGSATLAAVTW